MKVWMTSLNQEANSKMAIKQKMGICPECTSGVPVPIIAGLCASYHYKKHRHEVSKERNSGKEMKVQKPISRRSDKRRIEELQYNADRIIFLGKKENQVCPVKGTKATEVHHKKGRVGKLLLDQNFWLGVSSEGHKKIELEPEWAKEMGFSLSRLT